MGRDQGDSGGWRFIKALILALVLGFCVSLLFIGNLTSTENKQSSAAVVTSVANLRQVMFVGSKQGHSLPGTPDLIETSKRRVPNGPDPIHNRHVVETRRPPGRA